MYQVDPSLKILFDEIKRQIPAIRQFFEEDAHRRFCHCLPEELIEAPVGLCAWIDEHLLREEDTLCRMFVACHIPDRRKMAQLLVYFYWLYTETG